jgi:hypothetical protein
VEDLAGWSKKVASGVVGAVLVRHPAERAALAWEVEVAVIHDRISQGQVQQFNTASSFETLISPE